LDTRGAFFKVPQSITEKQFKTPIIDIFMISFISDFSGADIKQRNSIINFYPYIRANLLMKENNKQTGVTKVIGF